MHSLRGHATRASLTPVGPGWVGHPSDDKRRRWPAPVTPRRRPAPFHRFEAGR